MSWDTYWQGQAKAIDETEKQTRTAWKEALAVMLLWERWMRRRTVRGAMNLPIIRGGWIDTSKRAEITRYRAAVRRDAERMAREVRLGLGAGGDDMRPIGKTRRLPPGPLIDNLDDVIHRVPPVIIPQVDIDGGEKVTVPGVDGGRGRTVVVPRDMTPEDLEEIEREINRLPEAGGELEDRWELGYDALVNIARNAGYEARRVTETVVRLTGRMNRREDIQAYMDGGGKGGERWRMNRNNMRLSTTAHIRGLHRRRAIAQGIKSGVRHYRLDVPKSRLGKFATKGRVADQLWRVRTLPEWQRIHRSMNAGRVAASGFDTLGLRFGDYSYVVPVPAVYMGQAVASGRKLRGRWLGAAAAAAIVIRSRRKRNEEEGQ